jgi:hypothetical protein
MIQNLLSRFFKNPSIESHLIKNFGLDRSTIIKNSQKFKQQLSKDQILSITNGFKSGGDDILS